MLKSAEELRTDLWVEILPMTPLNPGYKKSRHHSFQALCPEQRWTHLRFVIIIFSVEE